MLATPTSGTGTITSDADPQGAHRQLPTRPDRPADTSYLSADPTSGVRRWAWLIILTVGLVLFELVHWAVRVTGNPNLVPSLLLLGAVVVPASFAAFLYGLNARFQVGAVALLIMAVVGGVIGVIASGFLEYGTLHRLGTLPMLAVAIIEETAKLLAPALALVVTRHAARPADGFILGVACGAGFAVLETLGYSAVALLQSHQNVAAVDALLFQRGLLSPATHMAWTGITAAALYSAAQRRWSTRAISAFAGTFLLAVTMHTTWDTLNTTAGYLVLSALSLTLLATTAHRILRADEPSGHERHTRERTYTQAV